MGHCDLSRRDFESRGEGWTGRAGDGHGCRSGSADFHLYLGSLVNSFRWTWYPIGWKMSILEAESRIRTFECSLNSKFSVYQTCIRAYSVQIDHPCLVIEGCCDAFKAKPEPSNCQNRTLRLHRPDFERLQRQPSQHRRRIRPSACLPRAATGTWVVVQDSGERSRVKASRLAHGGSVATTAVTLQFL